MDIRRPPRPRVLRTNTASANAKLAAAHSGVDTGTAGLASLGALRAGPHVLGEAPRSRPRRMRLPGPALKRVATDQGEHEKAVKSSFEKAAPPAEKGG